MLKTNVCLRRSVPIQSRTCQDSSRDVFTNDIVLPAFANPAALLVSRFASKQPAGRHNTRPGRPVDVPVPGDPGSRLPVPFGSRSREKRKPSVVGLAGSCNQASDMPRAEINGIRRQPNSLRKKKYEILQSRNITQNALPTLFRAYQTVLENLWRPLLC